MRNSKSLAWVLLHSLAIVLISINTFTGLRIATLNHNWVLFFSSLLPQGEVHIFHMYSGIVLTCVALTYILFKTLHTSKTSIFSWVILLTLASGLMLLNDFSIGLKLLDIHYFFALSTLIYVFVHFSKYFILHGRNIFKTIFIPTRLYSKDDTIILIFFISISLLSLLLLNKKAYHELFVQPTSDIIYIDGKLDEKAWDNAQSLLLRTYAGANFAKGESLVTIRALVDADTIFFSFVWNDPTKSINFMPLKKQKDTWKILESGYYNFDETKYYEDKLALMLSHDAELSGSRSVHLGPKPIEHKPANWHAKGYHYVNNEKIIDLWHWKAVRTNEMYLAEDEFISSPSRAYTGDRRYSAGILSDPKESGGYRMNWMWYKKKGIIPKRLPLKTTQLNSFKEIDKPKKPWKVNWYDYTSYSPTLDNYTIDTYMPSVIYVTNNFEGDKADVRAHATWKNGFWSLEMSRKLDTGSKYDLVINDNTYIWVALFDHAQIAHTRHTLPIHLKFGKAHD